MRTKTMLLLMSIYILFLSHIFAENPCDRAHNFCFDSWPEPSPVKGGITLTIEHFLGHNLVLAHHYLGSFSIDFDFYDPATGSKIIQDDLRILYYQTGIEAQNALYSLLMNSQSPFMPPLCHKPDFAPGDVAFAGYSQTSEPKFSVFYCLSNVVFRGTGKESDIKALSLAVEEIVKNTPLATSENPPGLIISKEFIKAFSEISAVTDEHTAAESPQLFTLHSNVPNPFNPSTVIGYKLHRPFWVSFRVYDLLGREVAVLDEGEKSAGRHEAVWNGRNTTGIPAPSGVYLYRLESGGQAETGKMTLLR